MYMLMSTERAEWVRAPAEMMSTPVPARRLQILAGDTAGDLHQGAAFDNGHCLSDLGQRHVVEHDDVRARRQCLLDLLQVFGFDFDFQQMGRGSAHALDRRGNAAADGDVVVLDENTVVEPHAVVAGPACAHRTFFQHPPAPGSVLRVSTRRTALSPRAST